MIEPPRTLSRGDHLCGLRSEDETLYTNGILAILRLTDGSLNALRISSMVVLLSTRSTFIDTALLRDDLLFWLLPSLIDVAI